MKRYGWIGLLFLTLLACHRAPESPGVPAAPLRPELVAIDTLMQSRPDSALAMLQAEPLDDPYYHLLLSEALYKNYLPQENRHELLEAMEYFDAVGFSFLAARSHYMNGIGYGEMDSVLSACHEYLKALEIMEEHFSDHDLVCYKSRFMALVYSHLCDLFTDQYLHVQAIDFAKQACRYYKNEKSSCLELTWSLNKIGSNFEMLEQLDSATCYYQRALAALCDTNSLIFRDIVAHQAVLDYKNGIGSDRSLSKLRSFLFQAPTSNEYFSRCLAIGELFYHEKQFDSAEVYLKRVFSGSSNVSAVKQAAEWLIVICSDKAEKTEAQQYSDYLVPFANLNENQGSTKSQLVEIYHDFERKRNNNTHTAKIAQNQRQAFIILGFVVSITMTIALLYFIRSKQLIKERREHSIKQAAMAGRLRRSNAELKKEKELRKEITVPPQKRQAVETEYVEEKICQHILEVCNDEKNPIKTNIPVDAYQSIALDDTQKAQLKEVANRHFGQLFEKLKKDYPELKEKDFLYCYLCLLGLDNSQIAVMTQLSYRTIWEREKRLKQIFNSDDKIAVVLRVFLINWQSNY